MNGGTAEDILALLDHLKIDTCKAVGISGLRERVVAHGNRQPKRLSAMVVVSATPYLPAQAQAIMREYGNNLPEVQWKFLRRSHPGGDAQIQAILENQSVR